jgi:hypothetical protein
MQRPTFSTQLRTFIIEVYIGHRASIERDAIEHARIDDCARPTDGVGDGRDEHTAFAANQKICGSVCKTIVPNLGGITDLDGETTGRGPMYPPRHGADNRAEVPCPSFYARDRAIDSD